MKKTTLIFISLLLILTLSSCDVLTDAATTLYNDYLFTKAQSRENSELGVLFGDITPNRPKNPETITHTDPALAEFLLEKCCFVNRVYPNGDIPSEIASYYNGIGVYIALAVPNSGEANVESTRDNSFTAARSVAMALGVKKYRRTNSLMRIHVESYSEFESDILPNLQKIADDLECVYLMTEFVDSDGKVYGRESGPHEREYCFSYCEYSCAVERIEPTDEFTKLLSEAIVSDAYGKYSGMCDLIPSANLWVSEVSLFDSVYPEGIESTKCLHSWCNNEIVGKALMINADAISKAASQRFIYLVVPLPKIYALNNGATVVIEGLALKNGVLSISTYEIPKYTIEAWYSHPGAFILTVDQSMLSEPINEVRIIRSTKGKIYDISSMQLESI